MIYLRMRQAPQAENCCREDFGCEEDRRPLALVVAVEGYGGVTEPGLRGTVADLRGMVGD